MAKQNKENDNSPQEDYFDTDPMRGARRQKRKARRHRTKESLRDLAKGDQEDFRLYTDYYDNFEEF
jgi:hypothetical protein